jgi:hypothetical protein
LGRVAVAAQVEQVEVEDFVEQPVALVWTEWPHQVLESGPKEVEDEVLKDRDALGFLGCQLDSAPILNAMVASRHQLQDPSV